MNCEEIRRLLAADYIDGELDEAARADVVRHLESCARCRQFEEAVLRAAVEPFRHERASSAPASIWDRVVQALDQKREEAGRASVRVGWERLFTVRKIVYAAASLAAIILIASVLIRVPSGGVRGARPSYRDAEGVRHYMREQYLALDYQGDNGAEGPGEGDIGYDAGDSVNFGTIVEKYLI